jgi:hypothetical protein
MSRVDAETALKIKETMKAALKSAQTNEDPLVQTNEDPLVQKSEDPVEPVTPPRKFVPKAAMKA